MPEINGKKYPYTKEGMRRYKLDKKKNEKAEEKPVEETKQNTKNKKKDNAAKARAARKYLKKKNGD